MLKIDNLEVIYKNTILGVKDISLVIQENSITALLGANGAGKTTTIRAITGLLNYNGGVITKGQITFNGKNLTNRSPQSITSAGIMQVPEGRRIFSQLTSEENLLIGSSTNSINKKAKKELMDKVYSYFPRLFERRHQKAGYLSGGEQQMLAVGRALMAQPKLLIIDELSLGLAPVFTWMLAEKLVEINQQESLTILLIEQNAHLALEISQYGYIVEDGTIAMEGRSESLINDNMAKAFLGVDIAQ